MTTGSALNVVLKLFQPADRTVHGSCVAFTLQVSDCVQSLANQIVEIEEGQTPTNLKAALPGFAGRQGPNLTTLDEMTQPTY